MNKISGFHVCCAIILLLSILLFAGCGTSSLAITSFSPSSGAVGETVTITGTGYSTTVSDMTVKFNGTTASISSATSTTLVVTVPSGATTGPITVTENGETVTSTSDFTVIPTIASFSPASGSVGSTVAITGTGFDTTLANNSVKFNGTSATITSVSETTIITTVPSGATTGVITVTVNGTSVATSSSFTVE